MFVRLCLFDCVDWCDFGLCLNCLISSYSLYCFELIPFYEFGSILYSTILVDACFLSVILTCRDPIFWGADFQV